jgi:anti-sigma B factor antagonist
MDIATHEENSVATVEFIGRLDTNTSAEAQSALSTLLDKGVQKIVIDFAKLDYISSAGLRVLLVTAKRMGASGGDLRLCGLNETVQEVFDISGFSTLLSLFPTREEALSGF